MAKKLYEESSVQAIADAIRAKNGSTDTYKIAEMPTAISAIPTGGSESDPRPIYGGTRPAEWLRLPDYDKVENNTMYLLVELKENYPNFENFDFRAKTATVDEGLVENGSFVSKTSRTISGNGASSEALIALNYEFSEFDWAKVLSDGTKQIIVRITLDTPYRNIQLQNRYKHYSPSIIRDIIYNISASESYAADSYIYGIKYMYLTSHFPAVNRLYGLEGLGIADDNAGCGWGAIISCPELIRLIGCPKIKSIFGLSFIEELSVDISQYTSTKFSGNFKSLRKLSFSGTNDLTSFPANIDLSNSNLSVTAVLDMFNSLPDISTSDTRTITLKNTPAASEGIPDDTLAVATNKGWTVVTA